jgi:hypothetical protein
LPYFLLNSMYSIFLEFSALAMHRPSMNRVINMVTINVITMIATDALKANAITDHTSEFKNEIAILIFIAFSFSPCVNGGVYWAGTQKFRPHEFIKSLIMFLVY